MAMTNGFSDPVMIQHRSLSQLGRFWNYEDSVPSIVAAATTENRTAGLETPACVLRSQNFPGWAIILHLFSSPLIRYAAGAKPGARLEK
jgi:hypothetical protein